MWKKVDVFKISEDNDDDHYYYSQMLFGKMSKAASLGAVHKVCHARRGRGLRKCDSLWQGRGVKIMWRHTQFYHISQFYVLFYILS